MSTRNKLPIYFCQASDLFIAKSPVYNDNVHMRSAELPDPESDRSIGIRLQALREVMGFSVQADWVKAAGVTQEAWNNWERGRQRISYPMAKRIVQRFNVGYDYIWRGLYGNVPDHLSRQLREKVLEISNNGPKPARKRGKRS